MRIEDQNPESSKVILAGDTKSSVYSAPIKEVDLLEAALDSGNGQQVEPANASDGESVALSPLQQLHVGQGLDEVEDPESPHTLARDNEANSERTDKLLSQICLTDHSWPSCENDGAAQPQDTGIDTTSTLQNQPNEDADEEFEGSQTAQSVDELAEWPRTAELTEKDRSVELSIALDADLASPQALASSNLEYSMVLDAAVITHPRTETLPTDKANPHDGLGRNSDTNLQSTMSDSTTAVSPSIELQGSGSPKADQQFSQKVTLSHIEQPTSHMYQNETQEPILEPRTIGRAAEPNTQEATAEVDNAKTDTENNAVHQKVEPRSSQEDMLGRRTRSGTRFSDDTNMLKDFLNRAQARKAATSNKVLRDALHPPQSPRRSPRTILGQLDSNFPSPQNERNYAARHDTPTRKRKIENLECEAIVESSAEPTSCRRSTRTRLPAPAKTPPGAPSFIPVRRPDGADPVVLQKSMDQQLAIVTRTNTRRNKGQSKPPNLVLQSLAVQAPERGLVREREKKGAKSVDWDERLVYYDGTSDEKVGNEDKRPKVRRFKGLGAVNGTPAAKRTVAEVPSSNGTPTPKRRGKVKC